MVNTKRKVNTMKNAISALIRKLEAIRNDLTTIEKSIEELTDISIVQKLELKRSKLKGMERLCNKHINLELRSI